MQNKTYSLELPWPPTVNHYHQPVVRGGKAICIKNSKVEIYQREVIVLLRKLGLHKEKIDKPVLFFVRMHPKTKGIYDKSNFLKAFEDALVMGGFLKDDHLISYSGIYGGEPVKGGLIELEVVV
ncbi:putative endodeoxyribonuclease, partial [Vibrio phage 236O40-1]